MRRSIAAAVLFIALSGYEAHSHAQATAGDVGLAETLFQEAQKLMQEKRYAEACPKFQESQRLDPGGGTLFQLATCHSLTGKTASAWAEFGEVALLAHQRNRQDIERAAKDRVQSLEPKLSRLVIVVPEDARLSGLLVRRDGSELGEGAWGTSMPADPGEHTIRAEASGYTSWTVTVVLGESADKKVVTIPRLERAPVPPAPPAAALTGTREPPQPRRSPALFYSALGVGMVGVGLATYFGVQSYTKEKQAHDKCPETNCSDPSAVEASKGGVSAANIANVAGAAGLVGLGVATYLLITGAGPGSQTKSTLQVSPRAGNDNFAIAIDGRF